MATASAVAKEAKLKSEMTELVMRMYEDTERYLQPMKPFLLVRTLPRSVVSSGGILLPEKQNKPNVESVVLAVYEPYWEKVDKISEDGKHFDISVYNECDVKVGDHIIHPHYVGLPDSFLDEREYRLIKEDDAVCILHYRGKDELRKAVIDCMLETLKQPIDNRTVLNGYVEALMEKFDVVPKIMHSKTTSGV